MKEISLVPQYAMSALNPTRKISRLIADLLRCHGVRYDHVLTGMKRRIALVGLAEDVLGRYAFELSGGMRQRVTLVLSTLLNRPGCLHPAGGRGTGDGVPGARVREERDRDHPRDTATIINRPLHPYTQLLLASLPVVGVRYEETTLTGIPGRPPALLNPPAGCRFADRCPFASKRCAEAPPFEEVRPGHFVACWKVAEESAR